MFYYDPLYTVFAITMFIISGIVQLYLWQTLSKYQKIPNKKGINGIKLVEWFKERFGYPSIVKVENTPLGDHYDPRDDSVTLSNKIAYQSSLVSLAITAHELGHAIQKHTQYAFFFLRSAIVPVTSVGTNLGYILIILGFILNSFNLAFVGLVLFSFSFIFILITLPVEFDASYRAVKFLKEYKLIDLKEEGPVKKILKAAALTYVAALFTSLLNLLYFGIRVFSLKDRD